VVEQPARLFSGKSDQDFPAVFIGREMPVFAFKLSLNGSRGRRFFDSFMVVFYSSRALDGLQPSRQRISMNNNVLAFILASLAA
jgi:hypothetical protein